jgi:hypothetical protein
MAKTKDELEAMTKDELVDYADDHDIEVHRSWLKDEIIVAIVKSEKAAAKAEAAAEPQRHDPERDDPTPKDEQPAEGKDTPMVSPEMADIQRQANQPPDPSTAFAAGPRLEEPKAKDK